MITDSALERVCLRIDSVRWTIITITICGVFLFYSFSEPHVFAASLMVGIATIASTVRTRDSLTHKASLVYILSALTTVWQWSVIVFVYNLTIGFLVQVVSVIFDAVSATANLDIIALATALWGVLWLVFKYILKFIVKSIPGGGLRLVTVVPAKKALTYIYKKVATVKMQFDRFVDYLKSSLARYWSWLGEQDLFLVIYAGVPIGLFMFIVFTLFIFAWGLKAIITAKAGEIFVEKVILWMATKAPTKQLRNVLRKHFYEPVHKLLLYLEGNSVDESTPTAEK